MDEKGHVLKKGRLSNDSDSLAGFLDELGERSSPYVSRRSNATE
jgi:hypothetical protein